MKTKLIFSLLITLPLLGLAQQLNHTASTIETHTETWDDKFRNGLNDLMHKKHISSLENLEDIKGSQYFNKEFVLGKIFTEDNKISNNFALRYNAYKDEIEIKTDTGIEYIFQDNKISCLIDSEKYIYSSYVSNNKSVKQTYLIELFKGNELILFKRKVKKYKEAKKATTTLTSSFPAKFVDIVEYYFLYKNEKNALFIKQKNKSLLNSINPDYKRELKEFINNNKFNVNKEKDLIVFFKKYDSIVSNNK